MPFIIIQKNHLASRLFIRTVSGFPVILWVRKSEGCGLPSNERKALQADYRVAVSVAESSAVLLKNEKDVLPLAKGSKAVFLGEFAEHPRYQGGGSSHVNSAKVTCALEHAPGVVYAQGYRTDEDTVDPALEQAAVATAADADGATGKKDDDASSMSMMMGIQLNTLIDFHVLTEEQLNGILSQINQA